MNKAARFFRRAFQIITRCLFDGLGTPIGAYIREHLRRVGQELAEQHGNPVEGIVFGGKHIGFPRAPPVERGVQQRFGIVAVRIEIRPLALSLKSAAQRVMPDGFLFTALGQIRVAAVQIFDNAHHFDNKFPCFFLFSVGFFEPVGIFVKALFAVFLCPL